MTTDKALQLITGLCSKKEYCTADILEKLRKWEISDKDMQKIMTFLYQHKFIDDSRFARIYTEDKFRFNHWGKQKINLMLRQKNIPPEIIAEALNAVDSPKLPGTMPEPPGTKNENTKRKRPLQTESQAHSFRTGTRI